MTVPAFLIREARRGDVDDLASVHVLGWRDTYGDLLPETFYGEEALERRKRQWIEWTRAAETRPPGRYLRVAEVDGRVIGVAFSGPAVGDDALRETELYMIYVLTAHHGTGAGQALLDAVLGDRPAQLWVVEDNPRAHAFYRRNGFAPSGIRRIEADLNDLAEVRLVR